MGNIKQISADNSNYIAKLEAYIDGKLVEAFPMPFDYIKRKYDIFHKYQLENTNHRLEIKWLNPHPAYVIQTKDVVIYSDTELLVKRPY